MHNIYTTPGFIIGSKPTGEAGKVVFIFTRDFGLVTAIAQGIRLEKSKLRYNMQDYSFGSFSLVKGKEFWRLTSAAGDLEMLGRLRVGTSDEGKILERGINEGNRSEPAISGNGDSGEVESLGSDSLKSRQLIARLALLLRRFLHGEEVQPALFNCVKSGVQFLESSKNLTTDQLETLESIIVYRILELLGYIGKDSRLSVGIKSDEFSLELIDELTLKRVAINQHINKALKESHL